MLKEKDINLEMLRIIACFLVIVNHTNSRIFMSIELSKTWFASVTYFFVCKIAVPIFIMISGAVLLRKNETYKEVLKKRILRTTIILVVFSLFYYIVNIIPNAYNPSSLADFFYKLYILPMEVPLWYLYMYLGLMVMLPIIRKMVVDFTRNDYIYFCIMWMIFIGLMPILNKYFSLSNYCHDFSLPIFGGFLVYFVIGHFIENKLSEESFNNKGAIIACLLFVTFSLISVLLTFMDYRVEGKLSLFMDNISFITISIPSISFFYLSKYYCNNFNIQIGIKNKILAISKCTLGIYLLSDFFIQRLDFIYVFCTKYMSPLVSIFILEIGVFIAGFVIVIVLKRIPLIKRII